MIMAYPGWFQRGHRSAKVTPTALSFSRLSPPVSRNPIASKSALTPPETQRSSKGKRNRHTGRQTETDRQIQI